MKKGYIVVILWALLITALVTYKSILKHQDQKDFFTNQVLMVRCLITFLMYVIPALLVVYFYYSIGKKK